MPLGTRLRDLNVPSWAGDNQDTAAHAEGGSSYSVPAGYAQVGIVVNSRNLSKEAGNLCVFFFNIKSLDFQMMTANFKN